MQSITRWLFTDDKALSPWSIAAGAFLAIVAVAAVQWLIFRQLAKRSSARARSWRSSRERQVMEQHESLVQGMLGVVMQFHALAAKLPDDDAMRTSFSASLDAADRVLTASQDVDGLPGPYPQGGNLAKALELAAEGLTNAVSPRVEVTSTGDTPVLRETTLVGSYRIAREAIVNALRHAKASKISVLVAYRKPELRVRVLDDGCGIGDLHGDSSLSGQGMGDMKRRSSDLHGSLSVVSVAGSGTEVEFRINLERTGDLTAGRWYCARLFRTLVRGRALSS